MDPATSAVEQGPRVQTRCQGGSRGRARCGCALNLVLLLAVSVTFAGAAYRARRRPRDVAFVATAYYLLALLLCCLAKLGHLARASEGEAQLRRVRLAAWAVSVALGATFASRVADAMPLLALKLAVWGVAAVFLGVGFYLFFYCHDAGRCRAELGPGQDAARPPAKASHELAPEEMV
ncbi:hypothetical protein BS78_03G037500 [Paspalum vaginatum]|nr:hypothetical protein BS78_03G037500 [Paspalum vaginatum]